MAGGAASYVLKNDGYLYSFGVNDKGQLGNGESGESGEFTNVEDSYKYSPVLVSGKQMKITPESFRIAAGGTENVEFTASRFNMFRDIEPNATEYKWEITDEKDVHGANAGTGNIARFFNDPNTGQIDNKKLLGVKECVRAHNPHRDILFSIYPLYR